MACLVNRELAGAVFITPLCRNTTTFSRSMLGQRNALPVLGCCRPGKSQLLGKDHVVILEYGSGRIGPTSLGPLPHKE